ncbi:MAG TPA: MFS transporter [Thermoanaerobaculia bacterium]|nr:MFS transporter [Thermoanaerobaculia bacterium]
MGRALRHRNYRLFFFGQGISLIGTWLTRIATSWLVYRLTGSALLLGVVGFAGQIPTFVLAPFAGVFVDRTNRHRVLVITQWLACLQSALLAYFTLRGTVTVHHVLALSIFQGLINAVDMPARQAFVVQMVESRADLPNAIALNSSMVNGARLLGPSVGGILIAAFGEGWCFAIDAASYLAVIASLLAMRAIPDAAPRKIQRARQDLTEGFRYLIGFRPIAIILGLLALISLMGMPYSVLMPIIADQVLHGGPHTLGWLMAAAGLGALCGALYLASRQSVVGLERVIGICAVGFGLSLSAFAFSRALWLSLPLVLMVGLFMMLEMAASNTVIQTLVDEDKRGRVMSFFAMAFFGTAPVGSLFAGAMADRIGAPYTILAGGIACVLAGAAYLQALPRLNAEMQPIYVRLGILPAVPDGAAAD